MVKPTEEATKEGLKAEVQDLWWVLRDLQRDLRELHLRLCRLPSGPSAPQPQALGYTPEFAAGPCLLCGEPPEAHDCPRMAREIAEGKA